MKKISTLFLGLIIALGAFAAPQFGVRGDRMHRSVTPFEHVRKAPAKAPAQLNGETITIEGNDLNIAPDSYFDMYMAFMGYGVLNFEGGFNCKKAVFGYIFVTEEDPSKWYGEYTADDLEVYAYDPANESDEGTELTISSLKYENTAKGDQLVAVGTDAGGNTYNINLTFFAPEVPNATVNLDFEGEAYFSRMSLDGFYFYADNDQYIASMYINSENIEGNFVSADFDRQYTGVYKIVGKDTIHLGAPFTSKADIKLVDGVYNIAAEFLTSADSVLYKVTMKFTKPYAKTTQQVNLQNALMADYIEDFGTVDMQAAPQDSAYVISLSVMTEKIVGNYALEDLDLYYSFVAVAGEFYDIFEAEFSIAAGENGTYIYKGWLLATNNVKYEFTISAEELTAVENFKADKAGTVKFVEDGQMYILRDGKIYNMLGAEVR